MEGEAAQPEPTRFASNNTGLMSDVGPSRQEQIAAGGEESENGRGGRSFVEDEFVDPAAPLRQELFNAARDKLRAHHRSAGTA